MNECPRRLSRPIVGRWLAEGFPLDVVVVGRHFRRSSWALPRARAVAHYRENVRNDALHLVVRSDRTWMIDHADCVNPAFGAVAAVAHFGRDVVIDRVSAALHPEHVGWWSQTREAATANARSALVASHFHGTPVEGLATAIAARVPYYFTKTGRVASSWETCVRRGYAACADAVAVVAAVAHQRGDLGAVAVCLELAPDDDREYAHVRAVWAGITVDPWPENSREVKGCARVFSARSLIPHA